MGRILLALEERPAVACIECRTYWPEKDLEGKSVMALECAHCTQPLYAWRYIKEGKKALYRRADNGETYGISRREV